MRRVPGRALSSSGRKAPAAWVVACAAALAVIPVGSAWALPAGMHYEMVSPVEVYGTITAPGTQSPDGERIRLETGSAQGFGDTPSMFDIQNQFVSERTSAGWVLKPLNPPASAGLKIAFGADMSSDLTKSLSRVATSAQFLAGELQLMVSDIDGSVRPTWPVLTELSGRFSEATTTNYVARYLGGSSDLSHVTVEVAYANRLLPGDSAPGVSSLSRLYEVSGVGTDAATVRRVDVDEHGAEIGPKCGAVFGGARWAAGNMTGRLGVNAMSRDGHKIFFSAAPGADGSSVTCRETNGFPVKLFARVGGEQTVHVSKSECQRVDCSAGSGLAHFQAASASGQRVAFLSPAQLTDGDVDAGEDLYVYDFDKGAGSHLVQASAGLGTSVTPGAGAGVKGVVKLSEDGSRVYFVATGELTTVPNSVGQSALAGAANMYVYDLDTGETDFVARLQPSETNFLSGGMVNELSHLADDAGRYLVFETAAQLVASDTDSVSDIYRFDAQDGSLVKVSPGNSASAATVPDFGVSAVAGATAAKGGSPVSADGRRVVFVTSAALVARDTNGLNDVYLWEAGGSVQLVSDGRDPVGVAPRGALSISRDGLQIAFATVSRLVPEDVDDVQSAYVAREGPDVERAVGVAPGCGGDGCQGAVGQAPSVLGQGSGDLLGGGGNVPSVSPTVFVLPAKPAGGGAGAVRVRVSGAGRIVVSGRSVGRVRASAPRASTYTLKVRLGRQARRRLARQGTLKAVVRVVFSARAGGSTSKKVTLTFKRPNARPGAAKWEGR